MKNLLLAGIVGAIMSVSCSTVKTAKTAQSDRVEFLKLKVLITTKILKLNLLMRELMRNVSLEVIGD